MDECFEETDDCRPDQYCENLVNGYECFDKDTSQSETKDNTYDWEIPTVLSPTQNSVTPAIKDGPKISVNTIETADYSAFKYLSWVMLGQNLNRNASKTCEDLGFHDKVGDACQYAPQVCKDRPCIAGCNYIAGHCPCLFNGKLELDILTCSILGAVIFLFIIFIWMLLLCCLGKCLRKLLKKCANRGSRKHRHHHRATDMFENEQFIVGGI